MTRQRESQPKKPIPKLRTGYLKFRTRWRHVLVIDQHIRGGQAPNCRELAEELEVSRRTILRDIDFLRYDLDAPVKYDSARRGYVYTEPNWYMPSIHISEGELFAILVAEKALASYCDTPWADALRRVFDRMIGSLPDRIEVAPQELLSRVSFDPSALAAVDPHILDTLAAAIRRNQVLEMTYYALSRDETRAYTVDPYVLRQARGAWYLAGRDHRSDYVPLFNVSRIRKVQPTGESFDYDLSEFDSAKYFGETFGTYQTDERIRVVIEFSGWAGRLIRERRWHASQRLKDLPGGRLRFEVTVAHLDDIWPWALSWGGEAKVIKPKELARLVAEQAAETASQYAKLRKRRR